MAASDPASQQLPSSAQILVVTQLLIVLTSTELCNDQASGLFGWGAKAMQASEAYNNADSFEPLLADAVREQLARILASSEFKATQRLRHFLTYIVDQVLAGQSDRIKAFTIATDVFGRDFRFDVQSDPVVRIEAGRLRRALERYYFTAGVSDPIVIDIPKGGYVPQFLWRDASDPSPALPPPARDMAPARTSAWRKPRRILPLAAVGAAAMTGLVAWASLNSRATDTTDPTVPGPSIVIRPFASLSGDAEAKVYAAGITDELLGQLARFKELRVFGRETSKSLSPDGAATQIGREFGVQYVLEGSLRISDRRLRVTSRLLDGQTAEIIWSQTYDERLESASSADIEADIAGKVATSVAQPYGVIFKPSNRHANSRTPDSLDAYQCVMRFYQYRTVLSREAHGPTRDCLEKTIARHPSFATGWAMLAYIYLDEDRYDLNRRSDGVSPIARARHAAEKAVRLDPENIRALQAQMTVLFFDREPAEALRLGEKALALNPNDTELLAEVGSRIAQAGDWKRGGEMLEQALLRNPGHTGLFVGLLAQAAYMQGDDRKAVEWIRRADLKQFSIYHFVAALIFARAGLEPEAAASRVAFMTMRPRFFDDFAGELAKRNFNVRDRAILTDGARQAGFPVAPRIPRG